MVRIEKCLICGDEVSLKYMPFCSTGCKDIDLGKWFNENYRIQTEEKLAVIGSNRMEADESDKV